LFYLLLPICWLGSVIRRFDENALMIMWLSPLIALFLANKIKHALLTLETKILTGLTSIIMIMTIGQLSLLNGIVALLGFMSVYITAFIINKQADSSALTRLYHFICSFGVFSLGLAVASIIGFTLQSLFAFMVIYGLYWASCFHLITLSSHLKRNEILISVANIIGIIGSWLLIALGGEYVYAIVPLMFLIATLYNKHSRFTHTKLSKAFSLHSDLLLHSIFAMSYLVVMSSLAEFRADLLIAPALAVHGALILFIKDRRVTTVKYSFALIILGIIKLATIDAANALLWQKVILFMGIGGFILVASFWYQKLVRNTDAPVTTTP